MSAVSKKTKMSEKVLIISSSPRKGGNSDILADEFARGAKDAGHAVEKVCLCDKRINFCRGCGVCNKTHRCVQEDDMAPLVDKMVDADVIVLATPVYFYAPCGQMKTFIDRCVPRYTEISDKDFYFILTAADTDKKTLERTVETLRGFTEGCLVNPHEKGVIYGTGAWEKGEIRETRSMKKAYEMGRKA